MRKQLIATAITIPMVLVGIIWGVGSALACDSHCQFSRGQISGGQLMHQQQQEWRLQQIEQQQRRQRVTVQQGGCWQYRTLMGAVFGAMVNVPKC